MKWIKQFFCNSTISDNTIKFDTDNKWVKAEVKGDCLCPECDSPMIVISRDIWGYAYCLKCSQYYVSRK